MLVHVSVLVLGFGVFRQAATAAADVFAYPQKGQSPEQQQKDKAECDAWAKQNSGVNPNAQGRATAQQGSGLRGAAKGAALGAAGGAIAGDAGKGAAIGGVGGAVVGRHRSKKQAQASQGEARNAYDRAFAACMGGRGYSVK